MPNLASNITQQKMNDLIAMINLIKSKLEAKYGPEIKRKWTRTN